MLAHTIIVLGGLVVLQDHTNHVCGVGATVYRREHARGVLVRRLIVKTVGNDPREACQKAHRSPACAWRRLGAIQGVTQLGAWPLRGIP